MTCRPHIGFLAFWTLIEPFVDRSSSLMVPVCILLLEWERRFEGLAITQKCKVASL